MHTHIHTCKHTHTNDIICIILLYTQCVLAVDQQQAAQCHAVQVTAQHAICGVQGPQR